MFCLQEKSLDYALTHVIARGDTDVFPPAFEFAALLEDWDSVKAFLLKQDLDTWAVRPTRRCLSPKRGLGFRIATQLDPIDTLLITAVVYEIAPSLESARVPTSERSVHSYRFMPTPGGQLYSPDWTFDSFRARSLEMAQEFGGLIVMTDIADFFPRLYHHRLENALAQASSSVDHVRVITKLLGGWTQRISFGLPVGPAICRLLAEVAIDDVDQSLLSQGYAFCRFSDDYRIIVPDERGAREACAFLAKTLDVLHGLTIQESKTEIVPADDFVGRFERTEEDAARASLQDRFEQLKTQLQEREEQEVYAAIKAGDWSVFLRPSVFDDPYAHIEYEDLNDEQKAIVDALNLWEVLRDQLDAPGALDVPLTRFVLNRIAQLGLSDPENGGLLLRGLRRLYPLFPEVVRAVGVQGSEDPSARQRIGKQLLDLFDHPVVGHLEYHRDWVLSVFSEDASWNHADELARLYEKYADGITRPGIVRALGTARLAHWFRAKKQDVISLPPWERRAFLAGAACLPKDELKHWYGSVVRQLDFLDQCVVKWVQSKTN